MATVTIVSFGGTFPEMPQEITEKMLFWDFSVDDELVESLGKTKDSIISAEKKLLSLTKKLNSSLHFIFLVMADEENQLLEIFSPCLWHSMSFNGQEVFNYGFGSLSNFIDHLGKNEDQENLVSFLEEEIREALQKIEKEDDSVGKNTEKSLKYAQEKLVIDQKLVEKRSDEIEDQKVKKEKHLELNKGILLVLDKKF